MRSSRSPVTPLSRVDGAGVITLDQASLHPRKQNEYVDTPHAPLVHSAGNKSQGAKSVVVNLAEHTRPSVPLPGRIPTFQNSIIRTQPTSTSPPLKKELPLEVSRDGGTDDSIICSKCNKCKCGACTNPRELPSKWLCHGKFNISPETVVESVTCVCCVKGVFYHYSKDEQDAEFECVSDPCAGCSRPQCCKRWTCILAMSLCLPCMCLYPPAKLGLMCCTGLYNKWGRKGCTCKSNSSSNQSKNSRSRTRVSKDSSSQCRGLLIESDRESSSVS